jgi:superfamily I DNA/RNA helicase
VPLCDWLRQIDEGLLGELFASCRTLGDEAVTLRDFIERTGPEGDASAMTLEQFAGDGDGNDRINLSTLHSSKGREFEVVILFGIDEGRIPRNNPFQSDLRESRRVFYVGFTRPEEELHILYSAARQSRFVREVRQRMGLDQPAKF